MTPSDRGLGICLFVQVEGVIECDENGEPLEPEEDEEE